MPPALSGRCSTLMSTTVSENSGRNEHLDLKTNLNLYQIVRSKSYLEALTLQRRARLRWRRTL